MKTHSIEPEVIRGVQSDVDRIANAIDTANTPPDNCGAAMVHIGRCLGALRLGCDEISRSLSIAREWNLRIAVQESLMRREPVGSIGFRVSSIMRDILVALRDGAHIHDEIMDTPGDVEELVNICIAERGKPGWNSPATLAAWRRVDDDHLRESAIERDPVEAEGAD